MYFDLSDWSSKRYLKTSSIENISSLFVAVYRLSLLLTLPLETNSVSSTTTLTENFARALSLVSTSLATKKRWIMVTFKLRISKAIFSVSLKFQRIASQSWETCFADIISRHVIRLYGYLDLGGFVADRANILTMFCAWRRWLQSGSRLRQLQDLTTTW